VTYQEALSALADPTRRRILEALRGPPRSVGEIARGQTVSRPAVSQHLKVLEEAGLVAAVPRGNRRLYRVRAEGLEALRAYLNGMWGDVLSGFAAEVSNNAGAGDDRTHPKDD
jgi:DNA-binding transcriptional ArsR family regulator